jgi:X-linked retinitis pigmentosa GTPase regulator
VLLENMEEMMLVVRVQEVEVKEGFGAIGAGDGKDAVVNAKGGEGVEMVGMGCAKGTGEGASADEANNEEGGENEAEDEASETEGEGESSGEDAGEREGEVDGPPDEDGGGEASE